MSLPSEQNTRIIERRIRSAVRQILGRRRFQTDFKHGHWWVTELGSGAQWDAVDAEGGRSVLGFDFEQVTEGES